MSEFNPYTPPQSDPLLPPTIESSAPLASPWVRLGASILDGLILMALILPAQWLSGTFQRTMENAQNGVRSAPEMLLWSVIGLGLWLALNWTFLQNGQTIGKKTLKLQIQRKDGSKIAPMRIFTHRVLPIHVVVLIPILGNIMVLIDALLIFRKGHNTLHDDIADSKVVQL